MIAEPAAQKSLLDIAEIDRRQQMLTLRRKSPQQMPRIHELAGLRQEYLRELTVRTGIRDDFQADLQRLESDISAATQRISRNQDRLAAASAKDAQALDHEIGSLRARLSTLEDRQFEALENWEGAEKSRAEQEEMIAGVTSEGSALTAEAKAEIARIDVELAQISRDRTALLAALPAELAADYERRASRGVGAALLRFATCQGCQIMLASTAINTFRAMPANEVAVCPECDCLLVRTEESGL